MRERERGGVRERGERETELATRCYHGFTIPALDKHLALPVVPALDTHLALLVVIQQERRVSYPKVRTKVARAIELGARHRSGSNSETHRRLANNSSEYDEEKTLLARRCTRCVASTPLKCSKKERKT